MLPRIFYLISFLHPKAFNHEVEKEQILKLHKKVVEYQQDIMTTKGIESTIQQEAQAMKELNLLLRKEEAQLRQKARIQWLNLGDSNNAYFHRVVKGRNATKTIRSLVTRDGVRATKMDEIKAEAINYFQSLLGTTCPSITIMNQLIGLLKHHLSQVQVDALSTEVTNNEVKEAMFSLHRNKAPDLDGCTAHFFKET